MTEEWFSDDAFWAASYPFTFPDEAFVRAAEQVERLTTLVDRADGSVLDLGCGPGRHAIPFARAGWRVTGVDRTEFLLAKGRAYAETEGVEVEWVREDMRRFRRPGAFDLVISLFTTFGYFDDAAENRVVLENALSSLKDGGALVMDVLGKEIIARIYQPAHLQEVEGGGIVVQRRTVVDDWTRMDNQWILLRDGEARTFGFRHWIYSGAELKALLTDAGFGDVRLYGGLEGEPYGPEAKRLVAVARKPAG